MDFDGKPKDSAKSAMKLADLLFKGIGDMLSEVRDELYVNEYILTCYTYFVRGHGE